MKHNIKQKKNYIRLTLQNPSIIYYHMKHNIKQKKLKLYEAHTLKFINYLLAHET